MNILSIVLAATRMLMPVPAEITDAPGRMPVDGAFTIGIAGSGDQRLLAGVRRARERLSRRTGLDLPALRTGEGSATLRIRAAGPGSAIPALGEDESYTLEVGDGGGDLRAPTVVGALRGLETFLQLVEGDAQGYFIRGVRIADRPRFPWRGLLIDFGRHFMPIEVLKRNLDGMAAVKLNVLHWHLTEDQGFRVESRRYPKLHGMGSDGQFYTQDQLRDLVAYAAARGIRVVPEFDMPGHVTSWLVGHPELATLPGPYAIGDKWGIYDPVLDPTRDDVYKFLDGFLGEMAAIFPDAYLHIGGDENNGRHWDQSPRVQEYKRAHGLADNHALQAHFNRRVAQILTRHGKKVAGWEEILHPDLPKDIVIQSWKGPQPLAEAARQGFSGLLSAGYYLDYIHTAARHYAVDPIAADAGLDAAQAARVLGGEACMWSEFVGPETIDSRIWPRMAAIAERFWSPATVTDVDDMYRRLDAMSVQLEDLGLTHEKNAEMMVRRLAKGGDVEAVRTLADVVEQVKVYARDDSRQSTRHTPLTRLVDAARPDSREGRRVSALVTALLSGASAPLEPLRAAFAAWQRAGDAIAQVAAGSPILANAVSLGGDLATVGRVGEEALGYLQGDAPPAGWAQDARVALDAAAKPKAEVELVVVEPVRALVTAAAARRP
jgi:hexosaminidase